MKATLLARTKEVRDDGAIVEVVIWELPEPLPPSAHFFKYRLYFASPAKNESDTTTSVAKATIGTSTARNWRTSFNRSSNCSMTSNVTFEIGAQDQGHHRSCKTRFFRTCSKGANCGIPAGPRAGLSPELRVRALVVRRPDAGQSRSSGHVASGWSLQRLCIGQSGGSQLLERALRRCAPRGIGPHRAGRRRFCSGPV